LIKDYGWVKGDLVKYFSDVKYFMSTYQHIDILQTVYHEALYDNLVYTGLDKKKYSDKFSTLANVE
jgi:hypothetical protein